MIEHTISAGKANAIGAIVAILFFPLMVWPFYSLWHDSINLMLEVHSLQGNIFWLLLIMLFAMILHELIHGLAWLILTKGNYKGIKFGLIWKYMTPYCHYQKPVFIWQYRIALLAPGLLIGIIPYGFSLFVGSFPSLLFSTLFTFGAIGDFIILWLIRHEKSNTKVQDHPDKIGCIIL